MFSARLLLLPTLAAVGSNTLMKTDDLDDSPNLQWWAESSLVRVMPDTTPPRPLPDVASISLAGNEHESFQIALRSNQNLSLSVDLPVLHTVGCDSRPLTGHALTWRQVGFVWADAVNTGLLSRNLTRLGSGWWPDPLLATKNALTVANTTTALWFTLYVSSGTPSGQYTGTISLHVKRSGKVDYTVEVPINALVYGFSLPRSPAIRTAFNLARDRIADKYGADMSQSMLMTYARWLLTNFSLNPGSIYEPPGIYSAAEIADLTALGMNALTLFPSGHTVAEAEKTANNVSHLISQLAQSRCCEHVQFTFYGFDESKSLFNLAETFGYLKRRFPSMMSLTTAQGFRYTPDKIHKLHIDIPTPIMDQASSLITNLSECIRGGVDLWTYVSPEPYGPYLNWRIDNALFEPRLIFWQASMLQISGFLYEGVNAWGDNFTLIDELALSSPFLNKHVWPLDTKRPRAVGVKMLTYPGKSGPIASLRLAAIRDGLEDYGYFALLRNTSLAARLPLIFANVTDPNDLSQHIRGTRPELEWMMTRRHDVARMIEAVVSRQEGSL